MRPLLTPEQFATYRVELLASTIYLAEIEVQETPQATAARQKMVAMGAKLEKQISDHGAELFHDVITLNAYCMMLRKIRRDSLIMSEVYRHIEEGTQNENPVQRRKKKGLDSDPRKRRKATRAARRGH